MQKNIIIVVLVIILALGVYFVLNTSDNDDMINTQPTTDTETTEVEEVETVSNEESVPVDETKTIIGNSVKNREITAYHYGSGDTELLFVGGIHGGYSWNTALVAYELMDYLDANPSSIPNGVKVTIIPVLNPDGLEKVTGVVGRFTKADIPKTEAATIPGRFNANNVDLNRNFACDWKSKGIWQTQSVSGGTEAFSEPESQAMRAYVANRNPSAVVVWYSAAGGVYASNCHNGVLSKTLEIANVYAKASGYKAYEEFNYYDITGDMVNWLAGEKIPAISVLLTTHSDTEWSKNLAGIKALLTHYAQ